MTGTYLRTLEIRNKQSLKMKGRSSPLKGKKLSKLTKQKIKHAALNRKYIKKGKYKNCPVCKSSVYYKPKELKEQKIKCCSRKCLINFKPFINKLKSMDKSYMQTTEYKNSVRKKKWPDAYKEYESRVRVLTESNYKKFQNIINPNKFKRVLCGQEGYQLDHIKSIKFCWNNDISIEKAAHYTNLQLLPWSLNLKKRSYEKVKQK